MERPKQPQVYVKRIYHIPDVFVFHGGDYYPGSFCCLVCVILSKKENERKRGDVVLSNKSIEQWA